MFVRSIFDRSFEMLSEAMNELSGKGATLHHRHSSRPSLKNPLGHNDEARAALATHVATLLPSIFKTILLLDDEGGKTRKKLLKTSFVRRLLLCPETVGPWITTMLRKKGLPSKRAIDYLGIISNTTAEDFVGTSRCVTNDDIDAFREERGRVFAAIDDLEGTIASLVVLEQREVERAAGTSVVWYIMNENLARPFVVSLVIIDFVEHLVLLFVSC
jgi:hypothetical protein